MKKYIELKENNQELTHICVEIFYDLGGYSYFSYTQKARGYYLRVTPVKRWTLNGVTMESFTAFTGVKTLLKEVTRKSNKAEKESEKIAETYEKAMIDHICTSLNVEVK